MPSQSLAKSRQMPDRRTMAHGQGVRGTHRYRRKQEAPNQNQVDRVANRVCACIRVCVRFAANIRFRCVERLRRVANVLCRMEHSECETIQKVTRRQQARYWTQRPTRALYRSSQASQAANQPTETINIHISISISVKQQLVLR
jgi:hypothetical protein